MANIDIGRELGRIQTALTMQGEMLRDMQEDIRCLQRKWWRAAGVVTGVVAAVGLIGTLMGVNVGMKRIEADYIRKDTIPIQAIVKELNAREAEAAAPVDDKNKKIDILP